MSGLQNFCQLVKMKQKRSWQKLFKSHCPACDWYKDLYLPAPDFEDSDNSTDWTPGTL